MQNKGDVIFCPLQQPDTQAAHKHTTHRKRIFSHTSQHTGSQHPCPDHREFVLSWLGRQDESMRGQLTGHAYSSAKEKREEKKGGARDSKRNEPSPEATRFVCITYFILQRTLNVFGVEREEVDS